VYGAWTQFTRWVRCPGVRLPRDKKASRVLETFNQKYPSIDRADGRCPDSSDRSESKKYRRSALIFICKHARALQEALGNVACTHCQSTILRQASSHDVRGAPIFF